MGVFGGKMGSIKGWQASGPISLSMGRGHEMEETNSVMSEFFVCVLETAIWELAKTMPEDDLKDPKLEAFVKNLKKQFRKELLKQN
jgi:hypothetical protein